MWYYAVEEIEALTPGLSPAKVVRRFEDESKRKVFLFDSDVENRRYSIPNDYTEVKLIEGDEEYNKRSVWVF